MAQHDRDADLARYHRLLDLWQAENPIKTVKLQYLLLANAVLIAALQLNGGLQAGNRLLMLGGALLCAVWTLSIGRTALFQKAWKIRLDALASRHPGDPDFHLLDQRQALGRAPGWLRVLGGVSSKYYLLGAPAGLALAWLLAALLAG